MLPDIRNRATSDGVNDCVMQDNLTQQMCEWHQHVGSLAAFVFLCEEINQWARG